MNGRQYQLIETDRVIGGADCKPLDDPDTYRALVDAAQVAQEERNLRAFDFEKVGPYIESATFCMCPACLDRFGERALTLCDHQYQRQEASSDRSDIKPFNGVHTDQRFLTPTAQPLLPSSLHPVSIEQTLVLALCSIQ